MLLEMYVNVNFCSSQAPLVPTELFHSLVNAVQFVASLIRRVVMSYNFFIPEFGVTKCMYNYMAEHYPELYVYEYPGQILNDVYNAVQRMIGEEEMKKKEVDDALVYEDRQREEDVPNSTVDTYYNEAENEIFGARALESPRYIGRSQEVLLHGHSVKWQTCSKLYAMESVVRYIIVNFILD